MKNQLEFLRIVFVESNTQLHPANNIENDLSNRAFGLFTVNKVRK